MKHAAALLMAGLLAACGGGGGSPAAPSTPTSGASRVVVLDSGNFDAVVLASPRPSLVEFLSPTCPACQSMSPVVNRLASDFDGRALVGTVDASVQGALVGAYRIEFVPTFVFFKNGREVSRQIGATSYDDLAGKLQALVTAP